MATVEGESDLEYYDGQLEGESVLEEDDDQLEGDSDFEEDDGQLEGETDLEEDDGQPQDRRDDVEGDDEEGDNVQDDNGDGFPSILPLAPPTQSPSFLGPSGFPERLFVQKDASDPVPDAIQNIWIQNI
jgi:hypothetical protein